jgi:hypothetical protein
MPGVRSPRVVSPGAGPSLRLSKQFCLLALRCGNRKMRSTRLTGPQSSTSARRPACGWARRGALHLLTKRSIRPAEHHPIGRSPARENRAWVPVRRIVQAPLSRGSRFVGMLDRGPYRSASDRRSQWSSTFSNCTVRAALSSQSPSSFWHRERLTDRDMIELPHEFVNAVFAVVIIVAGVRRSRNQLRD